MNARNKSTEYLCLPHVIMPKHAQLTFATMAKEKSIYFLFM